nr:nitrous oxide reductase accessory protein NosL [Hydrogenophilus thiooxidans]
MWAYHFQAERATQKAEEEGAHCETDLEARTPPRPYDPERDGPNPLAPRSIPDEARCPICGMYPARYPRWAAQRIDSAGRVDFYDAPRDLVIHDQWLRQEKGIAEDRRVAAAIWLRDYCSETASWVAADAAWFVWSPKIIGPMGRPEPAACATEQAARTLAEANSGEVLRFADLYSRFRW